MILHEYGKNHAQTIVLIHPSLVRWDYFEYVIPLLESYHLVIPELPGYDRTTDYTSVEEIAETLEDQLLEQGIKELRGIYGCSMGGSIIIRMLYNDRIRIHAAVIDGGITPYQLPWIVTRFIAVRDFLMIYAGKLGGIRLLEKAFATDDYSEEDLKYAADVLNTLSARTIWRTFDSCNNYALPGKYRNDHTRTEYWYSAAEEKERKWDIDFIKKQMPGTVFRRFDQLGHGGLAVLKPELLVRQFKQVMEGEETCH